MAHAEETCDCNVQALTADDLLEMQNADSHPTAYVCPLVGYSWSARLTAFVFIARAPSNDAASGMDTAPEPGNVLDQETILNTAGAECACHCLPVKVAPHLLTWKGMSNGVGGCLSRRTCVSVEFGGGSDPVEDELEEEMNMVLARVRRAKQHSANAKRDGAAHDARSLGLIAWCPCLALTGLPLLVPLGVGSGQPAG
jgi:hypothetical protein